ncbi:thioredoxin family protein [Halalkalibacterium halodurans]|uniref:BH1942 protein n=1 Tax=Halalkalibacterium halodurans (strain ATCC BAA-125 / DSM 18197 / FERM 7344 / JCM 9153 / C-125) TaxID=272558 RepID=Q9KBI5_HALH5|nr:thioredoxin family protein [Halalkalibacterium halodurans]MED4082701.1 thioredoxin family protein [Halalkalibacterium halodurans]MED4085901.1 thioredoxin family protein [Halalkalibacterium halodurans]MED4106869.1 thioredoxin family protein [Halalkalibacterium halodurans]MED4109779.1 thioredoxin family protein [Halalkalibacterium halodurans]MED4149775.1 thioredoxin family protein [Halalkalibacterium halodurans]
MKKLAIFGSIIVLLFVAIAVVTNLSQKQQVEGNPFGKETLDPTTIELLDDPNYQNVILPDELEDILAGEGEATVYFYASDCPYCKEATPRLVPIAEDLGIDLVQYNVKEFQQGWNDYNIESTPTIIHFENGEEVARLVGSHSDEGFTLFLEENVLD